MTAIVSRVTVTDDGTTRRTRITIIEGRAGIAWTTNASTIPAPARDELIDWLGAPKANDQPWRGEHGGHAHLELSTDAPAVDATIGFTRPATT